MLPNVTHALSFVEGTVFLEAETEAECELQSGAFIEWYGEVYCTQEGEVVTENSSENQPEIDFDAFAAEQIIAATSLELLGLSATAAKDTAIATDVLFRVVQEDGEYYAVTEDYRPGRINATIEQGTVVSYQIEGSDVRFEMESSSGADAEQILVPVASEVPIVVPVSATTTRAETEGESQAPDSGSTTTATTANDVTLEATSGLFNTLGVWFRQFFSFLW